MLVHKFIKDFREHALVALSASQICLTFVQSQWHRRTWLDRHLVLYIR